MKAVAVALAAALVCLGAGKRGITHEDLWLMRRVDAPVPSPDGKWIAFSVTEPGGAARGEIYSLDRLAMLPWLVSGAPALVTTSPDAITRDTLTFTVGPVNHPGITMPPLAAAVVSVASFPYDGP